MIVIWLLLALIALFLCYILIRAALFVPPKEAELPPPEPVAADEQALGEHLRQMLSRKTVSYAEEGLADQTQFESFRALLMEFYPAVFERFDMEIIGRNGLLLRLPGQGKAEPSVLMAHYDVVPVDQSEWSVPAFEGLIKDGEVWGARRHRYQVHGAWYHGGRRIANEAGLCAQRRPVYFPGRG